MYLLVDGDVTAKAVRGAPRALGGMRADTPAGYLSPAPDETQPDDQSPAELTLYIM